MAGGEPEPQRRQTRQGMLIEQAVMDLHHHPNAKAVHASLER